MDEMTSIEENDTWSLIDLPCGRKMIGVMWVFKVKRDEHGVVSKHKAHLENTTSTTMNSSQCIRGGRCTIWTSSWCS
jgi:hypothetical protein